jgi:hypothetical protein
MGKKGDDEPIRDENISHSDVPPTSQWGNNPLEIYRTSVFP